MVWVVISQVKYDDAKQKIRDEIDPTKLGLTQWAVAQEIYFDPIKDDLDTVFQRFVDEREVMFNQMTDSEIHQQFVNIVSVLTLSPTTLPPCPRAFVSCVCSFRKTTINE